MIWFDFINLILKYFMEGKKWEGDESKDQSGYCHHHGKHHLVKMILKLIIIIIVFWMGYQLGNITGSIKAGHGSMNRVNYGMMGGWNGGAGNTSGGAAIPAATK